MTRLERIRSPLLWLIAPLVVGFMAGMLLPKPSPFMVYITRIGFIVPLVTWITWMLAGYINHTNRMMWFYRLVAIGSLSLLFHSVLPADWPWWLCLIPGVILTIGVSIGLDLFFRPRVARTTVQTRSVTDPASPQGRQDQISVGLNMRAPDGQAAFVDAGTTVANMGLQAQANVLSAANVGRQIDAEQRKMELEHLKQVIDDPTTDQLTRALAKTRYYALLGITVPPASEPTTPSNPRHSTWDTTPYTRGKGVRN